MSTSNKVEIDNIVQNYDKKKVLGSIKITCLIKVIV